MLRAGKGDEDRYEAIVEEVVSNKEALEVVAQKDEALKKD